MTPLLVDLPGAVRAGELGVATHYGQPIAEARQLEEGHAVVDLSHRDVLTITGADRLSWLDSMTSQLTKNLRPGDSVETLLLSPQGRIEHIIRVVDDGETTWLLVDHDKATSLLAYLNRMRFALRVVVTDVSEDFAQIFGFEGEALDALRSVLTPVIEWRDPWENVQPGGFQYSAAYEVSWDATILLIRRDEFSKVRALANSKKMRVAGLAALDSLEIRAFRVGAADVDERAIPHELDWLRTAVHLTKGCYRGQETVAKVYNLGRPPRRLVMLHIEGSGGELPQAGALIYVPGKDRPAGRITRAGLHHEWGVIALALLRRGTDETVELEVELASEARVSATQETIVPASAGATREVPKLRRL